MRILFIEGCLLFIICKIQTLSSLYLTTRKYCLLVLEIPILFYKSYLQPLEHLFINMPHPCHKLPVKCEARALKYKKYLIWTRFLIYALFFMFKMTKSSFPFAFYDFLCYDCLCYSTSYLCFLDIFIFYPFSLICSLLFSEQAESNKNSSQVFY